MSYHTTSSTNISSQRLIARQDRDNNKNLISDTFFNKTKLSAKAQSVLLSVVGDKGGTFSLTVTRTSDNRNYNFETTLFEATVTSRSRAKNLPTGSYSFDIPSSSGDTYVFNLHADAHNNTYFTNDKLYKKLTVTQDADTSVRFFAVGSGITSTTLGTLTKNNKTRSSDDFSEGLTLKDKQITVPSAITDFGFFLKNASEREPSFGRWASKSLFFETTENNVGGTSGSSNQVTVADLTGLEAGMELTYITGTTSPGSATTIRSIDISTKTLTLSRNQAITSGHTMTFRAYGPSLIKKACGVSVISKNTSVKLNPITTSVRSAATSDISAGGTLNVNGTTGIGVGAGIRIRGLKKSINTNATTVASVDNTNGLTQGAITIANADIIATSARPLQANTVIHIDNCSNEIFVSGFIGVITFAATQQDIFLDMDKLLTQGTAS